jgi:cysteine synthase A
VHRSPPPPRRGLTSPLALPALPAAHCPHLPTYTYSPTTHHPPPQVFLIDPPGSSLYNKVTRGVMYTQHEAEGKRLRNPFDTITEGIGINRLTANFNAALIDGAFRGSDQEAVEMARYLVAQEGLFLGSSAAMNCVGAVKVARALGPGHTVVTVLCDGGHRHLSKFHNPAYLAEQGLAPQASGRGLEFID